MTTAKALSYAVVFDNCKTFGLRGNMEYRNQHRPTSQYTFHNDGGWGVFCSVQFMEQ